MITFKFKLLRHFCITALYMVKDFDMESHGDVTSFGVWLNNGERRNQAGDTGIFPMKK